MTNESTTSNEQMEGRASIERPLENGQPGCQCSVANEEKNVLKDKIRRLLETDAGDMGGVIRAGLFSGLWQDELAYVYCMDICANDFGCNCSSKLHMETKTSGITTIIVNWLRCQGNKKCYLAIMPTGVWERFRSLHSFTVRDVVIANWVTNKLAGVEFKELRNMHHRVTGSAMDAGMTQVLYGSASPITARIWMAQSGNLDRLGQEYCRAWHAFGIHSWGQVV